MRTKTIIISAEHHKKLKLEATQKNTTIIELLETILKKHFQKKR